jgi:adenine-specific DNA methylase
LKVRTEVSAAKLRGGFYSPPSLVAECFDRIDALTQGRTDLRLLEPAAGDGAFLRGLEGTPVRSRIGYVEAVELLPSEAARASEALRSLGAPGSVNAESCLAWGSRRHEPFDAAVGNPPFVRFQFVSDDDKAALPGLGSGLGLSFGGVSNLWIPVLLVALASLRHGGAFAFIVPSELFTGISANTVRRWLHAETTDLEAQLFPPGSFPGVLQEVIVLSGRRGRVAVPSLTLVQRDVDGTSERWQHDVDRDASTWTRYLLPPVEVAALDHASGQEHVRNLGLIAKFEVAAVTGANEFFSVPVSVVDEYDLADWVRPLLPRARLAPGLRYTSDDHAAATAAGARTALLDFSSNLPDPLAAEGPRRYLADGERAGLDRRYKTRIRTPWYRVPHIRPGRLMLSKRSHRYPRLILNDAEVVTTDTIYRGWMRPDYEGREEDLAAVFHNSLTMLSAEVEGRSFGGGVLELVPSEINRLAVPLVPGAGAELDGLSAVADQGEGEVTERLIDRTDQLLLRHSRFDPTVLQLLRSARLRLQSRRLARSIKPQSGHRNGNGVG